MLKLFTYRNIHQKFDNDNLDLKEVRRVVNGSEIIGIFEKYALTNF